MTSFAIFFKVLRRKFQRSKLLQQISSMSPNVSSSAVLCPGESTEMRDAKGAQCAFVTDDVPIVVVSFLEYFPFRYIDRYVCIIISSLSDVPIS